MFKVVRQILLEEFIVSTAQFDLRTRNLLYDEVDATRVAASGH